MQQMADRGWQGDTCMFTTANCADVLKAKISGETYDCVVVGAGVRLPPKNLALLETAINTIAAAAPGVPIAFNTTPADSAEAAARWLNRAR
jgi:hypothetical protein